jgi:LuxR family maltose regulon positive regulatory protein
MLTANINIRGEEWNGGTTISSGGVADVPLSLSNKDTPPLRLLADKLIVPKRERQISRPRLLGHLLNSAEQYGSTLVCGRAGTGKTALAGELSGQFGADNTAWYKVESADVEWDVFFSYLVGSLNQKWNRLRPEDTKEFVAEMLGWGMEKSTESLSLWLFESEKPLLVVLDDLHCVYDAEWFPSFFATFLPLFSANAHLLMTARSLPPFPLWRLRSKQKLSIVEEPLLAFTSEETAEYFTSRGLCRHAAALAQNESYGRIGKLKQFAELLTENRCDCAI